MKKPIQLIITFLLSTMLIACGGGDKVAEGNVITPTTHNAGKLIIDNGRGTVNNQDTEK